MPIKTNENALQERIKREVNRAVAECQNEANEGKAYLYFSTSRDIQRDIRDILEKEHSIYVPIIYSRYGSSRPNVEHYEETTSMKLEWG
jgi:hypothetical protein